MQRRQEDRPPALNEKSFESLPRMIKSSTRLGVGQFFFRNSGPGGCGLALQMFRVCVFPGASRPFQKIMILLFPRVENDSY